MAKKIQYDYSDMGPKSMARYWLVLGSIQALENPTSTTISDDLSTVDPTFKKATVASFIKRLNTAEFPGTVIEKNGPEYKIASWGVVSPDVINDFYVGYFE